MTPRGGQPAPAPRRRTAGHRAVRAHAAGTAATAGAARGAAATDGGFATLAEALAGLKGSDEHVLTLTVGSVFASRWLIWRIGKFSALHPEHRGAAGGDRHDDRPQHGPISTAASAMAAATGRG